MRTRLRYLRGAAIVLLLVPAGCARSSFLMQGKTSEYRNPDLSAESVHRVAIVPSDPNAHDRQIATRSFEIAQSEKYPVIFRGVNTSDQNAALKAVCEAKGTDVAVEAVAFVSWDRIVLRDCTSTAVAYEVSGAYAGVDVMTRKLIAYLRTDTAVQ